MHEIHNSAALRVYWSGGVGDAVVVTFSHVGHGDADGEFFARTVVEKLGLPAIGIVDRHDAWFPAEAMRAAIGEIRARIAAFREVVLFGSSMGGYGALRWSRDLQATTVIAWAPQWSISPNDVGDADRRYRRFYVPGLHDGMAVTHDAVDGRAFVFFDPCEPPDRFQAGRLAAVAPDRVRLVPMPRLGHEVGHAFAASATIRDLISVCRHGSAGEAVAFALGARRRSPRRVVGVSCALLDRRAACAHRLFEAVEHRLPENLRLSWIEAAADAAHRADDRVRLAALVAKATGFARTAPERVQRLVERLG
ncbi:hypothetical protein ROS9278_00407 [Roseomonas sp. CECT 9278]|nr:hypothetical protein ROS9278_00407 [Roseomonas sp. CECT 9278]